MKQILILNDIRNCYECPCSVIETGWLGDVYKVNCQVEGKYCTVYDIGRPAWCPLKPMPTKMRTDGDDIEEDSYCQGWNECIDAIVGETE